MKHLYCNIDTDAILRNNHYQPTAGQIEEFCNDKFYYDLQEALRTAFPECDFTWCNDYYGNFSGITVMLRMTYKKLANDTRSYDYLGKFVITRFFNQFVNKDRWGGTSYANTMSGYDIDLKLDRDMAKNYCLSATAIKKYKSAVRYEGRNDSDVVISNADMANHYKEIIKCLVNTRYKTYRHYIDSDKQLALLEQNNRNTIDIEMLSMYQPITDCFKKNGFSWNEHKYSTHTEFTYTRGTSAIIFNCYPTYMYLELDCILNGYVGSLDSGLIMLVKAAMMSDSKTAEMIDKRYGYDNAEEALTALNIALTYAKNIRYGMSSYDNDALTAYKNKLKAMEPEEVSPQE